MTTRAKACPHTNIRFCPLYHAAHGMAGLPNGHGCDDGRLEDGCCAVSRSMDYEAAVAAMREHLPLFVAKLERDERSAAGTAQRERNMRILRLNP
jgi:hypothetical protein